MQAMPMDTLNLALFTLINASPETDALWLWLAHFCAVPLIWVVPALLAFGWLRGGDRLRRPLLEAFLATLLALGASALIGWLWPTPRPFVVPVGHTFLEHAATPAFPSNHLIIMMTMACSLLLHRDTRRIGGCLLLLAPPVAWSRVFLGVHFPQDMLGALPVSVAVTLLVAAGRERLVLPLYREVACRLHQRLFAPLISRGWVKP